MVGVVVARSKTPNQAVVGSSAIGVGVENHQFSIHSRELPPKMRHSLPLFWNSCLRVELVKRINKTELMTLVVGQLADDSIDERNWEQVPIW